MSRPGTGATAAVFNTFRTTGLTLGVAIMGAIMASFGPTAAFSRDFDRQHHAAFVDGLSAAVTVNAVIAFVAAGLAAYTLRVRDSPPRRRLGTSRARPLMSPKTHGEHLAHSRPVRHPA